MHTKLIQIVRNSFLIGVLFLSIVLPNINCNKLVQVPEPISSVTSSQVFSTDATATSAILGIYGKMSVTNDVFCNFATTTYAGESADELTDETTGNEINDVFLSNTLTALNASNTTLSYFWQPAYYYIYCANSVVAGIEGSTGMTPGAKSELTGEAKFIRAFCYFYLTNLFGDLPLDLSDNFNQTVLLAKTPTTQIYQQIVNDLLDAQGTLPADFSLSGGQPTRANKWAAASLLARVYLYQRNWDSASLFATAVINSGQFSLVPLPLIPEFPPNVNPDSDAFFANSPEAILQLQSSVNNYPYGTWEGFFFVPYNSYYSPGMWLTSQLDSAFEPGDLRRLNWVDSTNENGNQGGGPYYYYPFKYKVEVGNPGGPIAENYTLLRFAEQYLIRAEAEANLGQLGAAINDLNIIRSRAGLPNLASGLTQDSVLFAVQQEWRIEFFAELGHRWCDLKRWHIAIQILGNIPYKKGIDSNQLLYPIPLIELQDDPNLTQNFGYQGY